MGTIVHSYVRINATFTSHTRISGQRSPGVAHFGGTLVARRTDGARALVGLTVRAVWTLDGDVISGDRTVPVNQVTVLVTSKSQ